MSSHHHSHTKVFASGELLVTDSGDIMIDQNIPMTRGTLGEPEAYVLVEFDPKQPPPPPCAGGYPDEVDWELMFHHNHDAHGHHGHHGSEEQLCLKICWRVSTARTVLWQIRIPV